MTFRTRILVPSRISYSPWKVDMLIISFRKLPWLQQAEFVFFLLNLYHIAHLFIYLFLLLTDNSQWKVLILPIQRSGILQDLCRFSQPTFLKKDYNKWIQTKKSLELPQPNTLTLLKSYLAISPLHRPIEDCLIKWRKETTQFLFFQLFYMCMVRMRERGREPSYWKERQLCIHQLLIL